MWSWWLHLFTGRPKRGTSSGAPGTGRSSKANPSDAAEANPDASEFAARDLISHQFCQYLLGSDDNDCISTTGTQIFNSLAKAFAKPDVDSSRLPRRPSALPKLIRMLNDDDVDTRSLTGAILSDPNLTGKILQVANSPFFRIRPEPINSIDQAIFILGKDGIRNLLSTTLFSPMMISKNKHQEIFTHKAWNWALVNAATAETLARYHHLNPSEHYLWGLFPPLAHLLIYQQTLAEYQRLSEKYQPEAIVIEKLLIDFVWNFCTHLATAWKLPEQSVQVFSTMTAPANYQRPHIALADAITLSQAIILNNDQPGRIPAEVLASALRSHRQAIAKATKVATDKLIAC
jgi:HD-like signal output (HDOD) protein